MGKSKAQMKFVKNVQFGTLSVTTVGNRWFGIKGGEEVTIHVLYVDSSIGIGGTNDFNSYGVLVQELVDVLNDAANDNITRTILNKFFGGNLALASASATTPSPVPNESLTFQLS